MNNILYLLVHDHKHGHDYSLHSTIDNARISAANTMRETLDEWSEKSFEGLSNEELWLAWPDISGGTEFFSIEELSLEN